MHPDLKRAIELQAVDRQIAQLSAEIAYLPRHIQQIENKLAGAQHQLDSDRQTLADSQRDRRKLEDEIPPLQLKISKYKDQIYEVKTNDQYKALQHEIEFAEGEIRKIEDAILERMIAAEELEARVRKAEGQLARERAAVEKEKTEATARTQANEEALAELRRRREGYCQQISPDVLGFYDTLLRHRKGVAVAEVRDGTCGECNVRLRPQAYQEVRTSDQIQRCENCGRILYYVAPQESQVSTGPQPASAAAPEPSHG